MIELKVTGTNYKEIKAQLFDLVNDIKGEDSRPSFEYIEQPMRHTVNENSTPLSPFTQPNVQPQAAAPAQPTAPTRAKRRSKAEIEADRVAKLQASQAEVANAQVQHAPTPINIPQVPTTNHVVSIPTTHLVETPAPQAAPVIQQPPPVQAPSGAYTIETFKANLIMILNSLLSTGKLNSAWIADTSQKVFNGQDIWLWSQNESKIQELFNMFAEWGFIQKFEG